jgi:hypothetical protein
MRRRAFISLLGGAAAAWPISARGQQAAVPVIGFLDFGWPITKVVAAFHKGLNETGYVEGRNLAIDPAPSSRCLKFSTSSKAAATRSFMWFRQPRTGRKPRPPRSNGLPAPRPSSIRVHRKCAHCAKEYLAAMGSSPSRNESSIPRVAR